MIMLLKLHYFFCCFILKSHSITGLLWKYITDWFNLNVLDDDDDDVCVHLMYVIPFHKMCYNLNMPFIYLFIFLLFFCAYVLLMSFCLFIE